jgi:hypothetical protein
MSEVISKKKVEEVNVQIKSARETLLKGPEILLKLLNRETFFYLQTVSVGIFYL